MRTLVLVASLAACGDNKKPVTPPDGAQPTALQSCLERPTDLPRPPTAGLTCDLLPPGLVLEP